MTAIRPQPGMTISRAQVDAVIEANSRTVAEIMRAIEACDYERAAVLAFARARAGESVPAEIVTQIVVGIRDAMLAATLFAIATGERASACMACVRDRMFPDSGEAPFIETVVLYAAWRAGATVEQLAPEARRLARLRVGPMGYALLYTIALGLGDENLIHATRHLRIFVENGSSSRFPPTLDRILASTSAELVEHLPAQVEARPAAIGYTIRLAPRTGRNEPCPCGSGQKFKKCCDGKQPSVVPSPVAGLSWDEYLTKGAPKMSADVIDGLPLRDLARVDVCALGEAALVAAVRRFVRERLFERAARGADELGRRAFVGIDDLREEVMNEALEAGDLETASWQLGRMNDPEKAGWHRLELDLRTGQRDRALETIAAVASEAVRKDDAGMARDLALTIGDAMPALGILLARGCLRTAQPSVNNAVLGGIEEARDALNLPPGDLAWDVHAALTVDGDDDESDDDEHTKIVAEATALRASLRDASSRVDDLERNLKVKQAQLESAIAPRSTETAAGTGDAADRDRVHQLRSKIDELKGLVRAGNSERADLRRQLAAAGSTDKAERAAQPTTEEVSDDADVEDLHAKIRGIVLPAIARRASEALDVVPGAVAAETLRTVGTLCAGDASAWRQVKQAKDMPRQLLMARIGIHHRMLFRVEARTLEVLDLITRENLLGALKRIRSTRS